MRALFVCTGNLCRSVMAEYLFNHQAKQMNLKSWEARSCGTAAQPYIQMPSDTRKALAAHGIEGVEHQAQLVNPDLIDWAEVAFAMASNHLEVLRSLYPNSVSKFHLFLEQAGLGKTDVKDPMGQSPEIFAECCNLVENGVRGIIKKNAKLTKKPRS